MRGESEVRLVVDRIEDDKAVLVSYDDDTVQLALPVSFLPEGTSGGDHLRVTFVQDCEGREAERERAEQLLKELKARSRS